MLQISFIKQPGYCASEKDEFIKYYGFDVLFDSPVCVEVNKVIHVFIIWLATRAGKMVPLLSCKIFLIN